MTASLKLLKLNAVAVVIVFAVFAARAVFEKNNYSIFTVFLSSLGVGSSAIWFNTGIVLTAVLVFAFYAVLVKSIKKSKLAVFGVFFGLASALSLLGVGFFPENIQPLHSIASTIFFAFSAISALALTIALKELKQARQSKPCMTALIVLLVSSILLAVLKLPVLEHFTVFVFGVWLIAFAFSLKKK